ncbi:hypothetical protein ACLK1U_15455 [Escherichia coli]
MEREQDSIIIDAATRRNLEITQNLAGGAENTLASVLDCTVTPMGSRMLKRWLHMPVRDTRVLLERSKLLAHCRISPPSCSRYCVRSATWNVFWHVASNCSPTRSGPYAPRFPATAGAACAVKTVDSAPVQALRAKMGEFAELRDLLERAIIDTPQVLVRDGGVIASGYNEELDEWRALADGATGSLERLEVRDVNVPAWTR